MGMAASLWPLKYRFAIKTTVDVNIKIEIKVCWLSAFEEVFANIEINSLLTSVVCCMQ